MKMRMIVVYKKNVIRFGGIKEELYTYYVEFPSQIRVMGEEIHEVNLIYSYENYICEVSQLVEVIPGT